MRLRTSLMKLEEQNASCNNMKVSQLMRFSMNVILIKNVMKVETEAKIDEPFQEYVKLINVRPVHETSAEIEKVKNVKTGKFSMVSNPLFVKMINQLKMIKLCAAMCTATRQ